MKKGVKISLIVFAVLFALVLIAACAFFVVIEPDINIPGTAKLDLNQLTSPYHTVRIYDKYGDPIDDAICAGNKMYVNVDELHAYTINAFIAIEDKRFYSHKGVDYRRAAAAAFSNIKSRSFREGASTITQQLIKNTHLSNKKTMWRKINEIRLARKLERVYDKEKILENYFNILYFGSGIRGLGTASRIMFDKPASELTLAQSAVLASIINNPSKYDPYTNPDNLSERKKLVLRLMVEQGFINNTEYENALNETIEFSKKRYVQFTNGLLKEASKTLCCSEKELFKGNYSFYTSYDPKLVNYVRKNLIEKSSINGTVRVLVLDNATGGIMCDETNKNKYIDPKRSPASAIKPFIAYAPALECGYNKLTQINDVPTSFGDYAPKNYKNVYRGVCSLEDCLVYSSNIAAVKLLSDVGIEKGINTSRAFGIPISESDNSLPIALGGLSEGIKLTELANAYRTLANCGNYTMCGYIRYGIDRNNVNIMRMDSGVRRVVGEDTAYILTDMLCSCAQRGTAKKLKYINNIAAKTGTNGDKNGNYDCYCVAYTPKYTVAVWYGADDSPLDNNITGASCCELIKDLFQNNILDSTEQFTMPDCVAYYEIDDKELRENHEVFLADPTLPQRYRRRTLLSKRHLPIRKNIDIIDFYDELFLNEYQIYP